MIQTPKVPPVFETNVDIDITIVAYQEAFFADSATPTHPPHRWIQAQWEAICPVAGKLGPTPETVRLWVRRRRLFAPRAGLAGLMLDAHQLGPRRSHSALLAGRGNYTTLADHETAHYRQTVTATPAVTQQPESLRNPG